MSGKELLATKDLLGFRRIPIDEYWNALRCERCGFDGRGNDGSRLCPHGCCVDFYCSNCDRISGGFGPAGCGCCDLSGDLSERRPE